MAMEMPLAYRIANLEILYPEYLSKQWKDEGQFWEAVDSERDMILSAPKFRIDNVAEYAATASFSERCLSEDVPNWMPPFSTIFFEWNHPKEIVFPDGQRKEFTDGQVGALLFSLPPAVAAAEFPRLFRMSEARKETVARLATISSQVLVVSIWHAYSQKPYHGRPMFMDRRAFIFIDPQGKHLDSTVAATYPKEEAVEDGDATVHKTLFALGLGIAFCHCKNVTVSESIPGNSRAWHNPKKGPVFRFNTISIDPMREVLRREGRSEETGLRRALHLCRGHFATYAEDRPMFGRPGAHGSFWIPQHVRGSADQGIVVSDYNVKPLG